MERSTYAGIVASLMLLQNVCRLYFGSRIVSCRVVGHCVAHDLTTGLEHALRNVQRASGRNFLDCVTER